MLNGSRRQKAHTPTRQKQKQGTCKSANRNLSPLTAPTCQGSAPNRHRGEMPLLKKQWRQLIILKRDNKQFTLRVVMWGTAALKSHEPVHFNQVLTEFNCFSSLLTKIKIVAGSTTKTGNRQAQFLFFRGDLLSNPQRRDV